MPHAHETTIDVWATEGRFQQLIFSPKGGIEGLLIDTDGVPTQFVVDTQDPAIAELLVDLKSGQRLVVEGTEAGPSPKGEPEHSVYRFERLASIDGRAPRPSEPATGTRGTVVRFNYARHGAANGLILDNGDFVHLRPEGFAELGARLGDKVEARGPARPLVTGKAHVIEAVEITIVPVGAAR